MATEPTLRQRVLALVPDEPRWVDVRGLLLRGGVEIVESPPGEGWVVVARDIPIAMAVGRPDREASAKAGLPLLCPEDDAGRVAGLLPGWARTGVTLFTLDPAAPLPDAGPSRVLTSDEKGVFVHVPEPLRTELTAALARTPLAAAFEDRRAVSFCYAHHVTETLWDVSVDTLERSRRRGHAVRAASCLIRRMRKLGKEPVWGAEDSNPGSRRAAERLGFVPAARFSLFRPP